MLFSFIHHAFYIADISSVGFLRCSGLFVFQLFLVNERHCFESLTVINNNTYESILSQMTRNIFYFVYPFFQFAFNYS